MTATLWRCNRFGSSRVWSGGEEAGMKSKRLVPRTRHLVVAVGLAALVAVGLTLGLHGSGGGPSAQPPLTTVPTSGTVTTQAPPSVPEVPTTSIDPTDCQSGSVSLTATLLQRSESVCLVTGSILHATFDTSAGGGMGIPGPWSGTPMVADSTVLVLSSSSTHGRVLEAAFTAGDPGTTTVSAYYDNECSSEDVTPCTVPPLGTIGLTVQVVAQP
jgi:hypothetical protein